MMSGAVVPRASDRTAIAGNWRVATRKDHYHSTRFGWRLSARVGWESDEEKFLLREIPEAHPLRSSRSYRILARNLVLLRAWSRVKKNVRRGPLSTNTRDKLRQVKGGAVCCAESAVRIRHQTLACVRNVVLGSRL